MAGEMRIPPDLLLAPRRPDSTPFFNTCMEIDCSGGATADSSLKQIDIHAATPSAETEEVLPRLGPRKYWSRRTLAGFGESGPGDAVVTQWGTSQRTLLWRREYEPEKYRVVVECG